MIPQSPCFQCKDRTITCHDDCEKYLEYKQRQNEYNLQAKKRRQDEFIEQKSLNRLYAGKRNK